MVASNIELFDGLNLNVEYDKVSDFDIPGLQDPATHVKNFKVYKDDVEVEKMSGSYFVIDLSAYNYFHFIHSQIGQYELLKKTIKKLKPLFVVSTIDSKKAIPNILPVLDMLSLYNMSEDGIIIYSDTGFWAENLYFYDSRSILLHKSFGITDREFVSQSSPDFVPYTIEIAKILNKKFDPYMSKEQNKKTYLVDGGAISNEDELINWAKSKGYNIFKPYEKTLFDQIAAVSSSRIIAGVNGSSLTNIMFARPGATVIIFDPLPNHQWCHIEIAKALGLGVKRMMCEVPEIATFKPYEGEL